MKFIKQAVAILLAIALCFAAFACNKDAKKDKRREAVYFTLGNHTVKAGEIADSYNDLIKYMGQFGPVPTDEETIKEYLGYVADDLFGKYANLWKADELGIALTDDEKAKIDADVQIERESFISEYLDAARQNHIADTNVPTEDELRDEAMKTLEKDAMDNAGVTFDEYMQQYLDYLLKEKLTSKLRDYVQSSITLSDEELETYYGELLEEYKKSYTEKPTNYRADYQAFENHSAAYPPLWIPDGYANISLITIKSEGTLPEDYESNKGKLAALEAEFGKLVLADENPERQEEIKTEYAALQTTVKETYDQYADAAGIKANEALAEATAEGADFTVLMGKYNAGEKADKRLVYLNETDTSMPAALWEAITKLEEGQVSEVIEIDGIFYIVKLDGKVASEAVAFSTVIDALREEKLEQKFEAVWAETQKAWLEEAKNVATINEDAISWIGRENTDK